MYARVVSMSGPIAERREEMLARVYERSLPTMRQLDGFAGYVGLYDVEHGRAKILLLWESEEAADAAEVVLGEFRAQNLSELGITLESVDLYEAPVVELEAARA